MVLLRERKKLNESEADDGTSEREGKLEKEEAQPCNPASGRQV